MNNNFFEETTDIKTDNETKQEDNKQEDNKQEDNKQEDNKQEDIVPIDEFDKMGLNDELLHGIITYGFEKPSYVQAYAVQLFNLNRDLIIQSQSGTGKTGTFLIGSLNKIDQTQNGCQVLIILPTRELAKQVHNICNDLSQYMNVKSLLFIGDDVINYNTVKFIMNNNPCVIVGTPGKIYHYMLKAIIKTDIIKFLIMDEADELLKDIFIQHIKYIIKYCGKANICLFSATMSNQFTKITNNFMVNPLVRYLKPEELTLEGIKQYYIVVNNYSEKFEILKELYDKISINQAIIYVNQKKRAVELKSLLVQNGFTISVIHGGLSTIERNSIMTQFKSGKTRILISTDLLSRGIDIQQISLVINYEVPEKAQMESYIHRIGRSGRFGRKGTAINFVHFREFDKINYIQQMYHTVIDELPPNFVL